MESQNISDHFNSWIKESIMIKLMSIGILVLILLIPTAWVTSIMEERQLRASAVSDEVASKWSGKQTMAGPVLIIPFKKAEKVELGNDRFEYREVTDYAFFLPDQLTINGSIAPQILHRGIFDVAVYESQLSVHATFDKPIFSKLGIANEKILWNEARMTVGISDLRGITKNPNMTIDGKGLAVEPTNDLLFSFPSGSGLGLPGEGSDLSSGVETVLGWKSEEDFRGDIVFSLSLKGSSLIRFLPVGKTTELTLRGPWSNPSFDGEFLPTTRVITDSDFEAKWSVLHFNRPFSQEWLGTGRSFEKYDLVTRLIIPADQYQKSIRTAKYGILLILLSFTALLMVELLKKIRIHPFQYILIGAALIVYYSLLISLSEHLGFDFAYLLATVATVGLVTLYSRTFLNERRLQFLLSGLISFFYIFIFVIIQAQDYSLLMGSVGLFLVIAAIMYFSKSINWYGDRR